MLGLRAISHPLRLNGWRVQYRMLRQAFSLALHSPRLFLALVIHNLKQFTGKPWLDDHSAEFGKASINCDVHHGEPEVYQKSLTTSNSTSM